MPLHRRSRAARTEYLLRAARRGKITTEVARVMIDLADATDDPTVEGRCPVHRGSIHGSEAEELRSGIEAIVNCEDSSGVRQQLTRLLDRVDARDSLAPLEHADRIAALEATVQRLTAGAPFDDVQISAHGARNLLVELDTRNARIAELETRRDELLALTVRLTNEVAFPDEVKGWTAQCAVMIAEIGTLRARAAELSAQVDRLTAAAERRALRKTAAVDIPETKHETSASIAAWQNETFGPATTTRDRVQHSREAMINAIGAAAYRDLSIPRPNLSRAIRAVEELAELISALVYDDSDPKACMEVADVQIVLAGIPAWHGQEQGDLVDHKMALNRARHWNRTGDGHGQHIKEKP
jgi:hypothetical protein